MCKVVVTCLAFKSVTNGHTHIKILKMIVTAGGVFSPSPTKFGMVMGHS